VTLGRVTFPETAQWQGRLQAISRWSIPSSESEDKDEVDSGNELVPDAGEKNVGDMDEQFIADGEGDDDGIGKEWYIVSFRSRAGRYQS
jgi:hypothetical protein